MLKYFANSMLLTDREKIEEKQSPPRCIFKSGTYVPIARPWRKSYMPHGCFVKLFIPTFGDSTTGVDMSVFYFGISDAIATVMTSRFVTIFSNIFCYFVLITY